MRDTGPERLEAALRRRRATAAPEVAEAPAPGSGWAAARKAPVAAKAPSGRGTAVPAVQVERKTVF